MALPQTVGFKAEVVDEEGVWCACTVEEVDDDYVIISFDGVMRSGIAASVIHVSKCIQFVCLR